MCMISFFVSHLTPSFGQVSNMADTREADREAASERRRASSLGDCNIDRVGERDMSMMPGDSLE